MVVNKKKRILIFSTAYFPLVGGAEVAVKEITRRIVDTDFVMITARLRKDLPMHERIENIEVHRLGKGNGWDKFRLIFQGHKKAKELGKFDLVWSIMASFAGFAALKYKKRNKNVPFLLTLQEGDSRWHIYKHVWFVWPYFKQIFKRADKIQVISNYLSDWVKKMGAKCSIEVVPNGVDLEKFRISNFEFRNNFKFQITNDLKISEGVKLIITVSRLVKKNGVGDLVKSMEFLPEDYHLLIAGSGELESELKEIANDRVHFLGNISHDELSKYFSMSDVFCRPSLSEGLGNAFLEAMAIGVPVIGTNVGGIPDFLEDGKTGWFCEVRNPKSIAEKIKYILDEKHKEEVSKVTENARKMVEEKYNWDLITDKMKNIFDNLCR